MKKYIIMSILTSFFALIGCKNNEENFLQKNKVVYYNTNEFLEFEKKANISLSKAWAIQKEFAENNNILPENWLFFVIDDCYVFNSAISPKEAKTFISGIWVNSVTGKAELKNTQIRLRYKSAYNGDGKNFPF